MTIHQWLAAWSSWIWPLLANHLWQATLISLVAFAAAYMLRKAPGRARYMIWLIASAKFVLPSVLLLPLAGLLRIDFSGLLALTRGPMDQPAVIVQITAPIVQSEEPIGSAP